MNTIINCLCAIALAFLLSISYMLDGPSELQAAQDIAADVQDAQNTAREQVNQGNQ